MGAELIDYRQSGRNLLQVSGWHPDRQVDVTEAVRTLEADEYNVWPELRRFLQSFSDMEFTIRESDGDSFWIDSAEASQMIYPERVSQYAVEFGTYVAPIGAALNDHIVVYFGENGGLYGSYDRYTCRVGADIEEALGRLVARELETITEA